ncbi:hypothetical protein FRC02_006697 [Tulasnella sp. 418]|nr:hypothetical protein FRC02_006697 [Tulasnella sp. 418]
MFLKLSSVISFATVISSVLAAPLEGTIGARDVTYKGWLKVIRTDQGRQSIGWLSKKTDGKGYHMTTDESERLAVTFNVPDGGVPYAIKTLNSDYTSTPWLGWYPKDVGPDGSFSYAVLSGATHSAAPYTPPVQDPSGWGQTETTTFYYNPTNYYVSSGYWTNPDNSQVSGTSMWLTEDNYIQLTGQGMKGYVYGKRGYYDTYPYPITFEWENCYDKC